MKYLDSYFDQDALIETVQLDAKKYRIYLDSIKESFDNTTFSILKTGELHDNTVTDINFKRYYEEEKYHLNISLTLVGYEFEYMICYKEVESFSIEKNFDNTLGFDDILVDECLLESNLLRHELVFAGGKSWFIKSRDFMITKKISTDESYM